MRIVRGFVSIRRTSTHQFILGVNGELLEENGILPFFSLRAALYSLFRRSEASDIFRLRMEIAEHEKDVSRLETRQGSFIVIQQTGPKEPLLSCWFGQPMQGRPLCDCASQLTENGFRGFATLVQATYAAQEIGRQSASPVQIATFQLRPLPSLHLR